MFRIGQTEDKPNKMNLLLWTNKKCASYFVTKVTHFSSLVISSHFYSHFEKKKNRQNYSEKRKAEQLKQANKALNLVICSLNGKRPNSSQRPNK